MRRNLGENSIPNMIDLGDGQHLTREGWTGRIQHIKVQHRGLLSSSLKARGGDAIITSILVVPDTLENAKWERGSLDAVSHGADYGDLEFNYNGRTYFRGPLMALANRYHGLTKATIALERQRMIFDPRVGLYDWFSDGVFTGALPMPVWCRDGLSMNLVHHAGADEVHPFTVELQYMLRWSPDLEWR